MSFDIERHGSHIAYIADFGSVELYPEDNTTIELEMMFIRKELIGQGLGWILFHKAIEHAKQHGYKKISLTPNTKAVAYMLMKTFDQETVEISRKLPHESDYTGVIAPKDAYSHLPDTDEDLDLPRPEGPSFRYVAAL